MKKFKQYIIGIIIGGLIFSGIPVLAETGLKTIQVAYNDIKITLDGKEIKTDAEPFQFLGRTFLPIRQVVEAMGASVNWNTATNTVELVTSAPAPKPTPDTNPTLPVSPTLKNAAELKSYLEKNYSKLSTCIGETKFTFAVEENDRTYNPYDYHIMVHYNDKYFYEARSSIKYTDKQKETLGKQLRNHQKNIAIAVIKAMPDKKFYGRYYEGSWKYPNLKIDWQEYTYCSWINFTLSDSNSVILTNYEEAKITNFKWYTEAHDGILPGEQYDELP